MATLDGGAKDEEMQEATMAPIHEESNDLTPVSRIIGEDEVDTKLLREMADRAELYLTSFKWCPPIAESFLGFGVGGIIAVYLFRLSAKIAGTDDKVWVVVGDIPSAYVVTDQAPDAISAIKVYCDLMDEWATAVLHGKTLQDVFPVAAAPTFDNASQLTSRIKFIREKLIAS
jgi:hypothetical protein